jgi:hypothetical protein
VPRRAPFLCTFLYEFYHAGLEGSLDFSSAFFASSAFVTGIRLRHRCLARCIAPSLPRRPSDVPAGCGTVERLPRLYNAHTGKRITWDHPGRPHLGTSAGFWHTQRLSECAGRLARPPEAALSTLHGGLVAISDGSRNQMRPRVIRHR